MLNKKIYKHVFLISVIIIFVFSVKLIKENTHKSSKYINNIENVNQQKNLELTNKYIQNNIIDLIRNYENAMVKSINKNNFSIVEPYLIPNSNLYKSQKYLVTNLYKRNIKEQLLDVQVENIEFINGVYNVYVYEKFNITYGKKGSKIKEFNYIYEVKKNNEKLGLSDIFSVNEKFNTYSKHLEKQFQINYNNEDYYKPLKNIDNANKIYENPSKYIGKKIEISGTIIYIKENFNSENILISNGKNIFHVFCYKNVKHFKGDKVIVYGKIIGETSDYNINNISKSIPSIYGNYIYVY
ncbi:TcaA NTF2-like domain-containing protein [Tepidibacter thalassicus]|uniref:TcaA protein NTF2-like domain-containing protein n=1 Tax=Tepidibacter thalassicus DSM 15285 TaxID=1123350 RepID=A0A1M5P125_9FIRM|nr:hypothetical protein [Tepidibacter thalassicus]SHG95407.1 hypothetical protein SAMN02744040_00326 [Tepidibacter thalassicus DSM 15285]